MCFSHPVKKFFTQVISCRWSITNLGLCLALRVVVMKVLLHANTCNKMKPLFLRSYPKEPWFSLNNASSFWWRSNHCLCLRLWVWCGHDTSGTQTGKCSTTELLRSVCTFLKGWQNYRKMRWSWIYFRKLLPILVTWRHVVIAWYTLYPSVYSVFPLLMYEFDLQTLVWSLMI